MSEDDTQAMLRRVEASREIFLTSEFRKLDSRHDRLYQALHTIAYQGLDARQCMELARRTLSADQP